MMTEDQTSPLPPSATPPYPAREAPHPQRDEALKHLPETLTKRMPEASGQGEFAVGALGVTLIGGAVAAAVGLLVALPFLKRKPKPEAKPAAKPRTRQTPAARRPRRKRSDD